MNAKVEFHGAIQSENFESRYNNVVYHFMQIRVWSEEENEEILNRNNFQLIKNDLMTCLPTVITEINWK